MKVAIVRGGGLAGMTTTTRLESAALAPPQAAELEAKVRAAGLLRPSAAPSAAPSHPDDLLYEIDVEDGGSELRHRYRDSELPESVRSLVEWVDSIASA